MRTAAVEQARNQRRRSEPAKKPARRCEICTAKMPAPAERGRRRRFCGLGRCRTESKLQAEARRARESRHPVGPVMVGGQLRCECSNPRDLGKHACDRCLSLEGEQRRTANKRAVHDWQEEDSDG